MNRMIFIATLLALFATSTSEGQDTESAAITSGTIMEAMVVTITPASDIIWGVEDPQTDEEWQVLDDAAVTLMETFEATRKGGGGPNDDAWASEAGFQVYIDQEMVALEQARAAIEARDLDGLFDAGGELYTPCEECHIDYNPGVAEEPY